MVNQTFTSNFFIPGYECFDCCLLSAHNAHAKIPSSSMKFIKYVIAFVLSAIISVVRSFLYKWPIWGSVLSFVSLWVLFSLIVATWGSHWWNR